jgi:hypothetical protein
MREKVRGEYRGSSLMKQKKKAKICFVIYIAGFFFKFFLLWSDCEAKKDWTLQTLLLVCVCELSKPAILLPSPSPSLRLPPFSLHSLFSSKANQRAAGFIFSVRGAGIWGGPIEETRPLPTSPPSPPSMLSSASAQKHQCSNVLLVVILYGQFSRTLTFEHCFLALEWTQGFLHCWRCGMNFWTLLYLYFILNFWRCWRCGVDFWCVLFWMSGVGVEGERVCWCGGRECVLIIGTQFSNLYMWGWCGGISDKCSLT